MNKQQLKFILKLNQSIEKACPMLDTERAHFMPTLDRFFQAVSLGMEMGLKMKGQPKSTTATEVQAATKGTKKPAKKASAKADRASAKADRSTKVLAAVQNLLKKNESMRLVDITKSLGKLVSDLSDPGQAVWKMLKNASTVEGVPGKRGSYRLKKTNGKGSHVNGKSAVAVN